MGSTPLRTKVAIVGTALSRVEAPYSDPSVEVWGMNGLWADAPRVDRWFEMHDPNPGRLIEAYGDEYLPWLTQFAGPIYMQRPVGWAKSSVAYPLAEMVATFGEVFACTPCYALALAIHDGFREIAIYGMDLTGTDEYLLQREWVQRLIGEARGRGITVTLPDGCALRQPGYRYGYEARPAIPGEVSAAAKRERALAEQQRNQALAEMNRAEGARLAFQQIRRLFPAETASSAVEALDAAVADQAKRRDSALCVALGAEGAITAASRLERTYEHMARGGAA